jgi:hypothetical protein
MSTKVLFLDIDGVLNNQKFFMRRDPRADGLTRNIDPEQVKIVNRINQETGCHIVVSSSWRASGLKTIIEAFNSLGSAFPIVDSTPWSRYYKITRGEEIKAWLLANPQVKRYAILDDDRDMLPDQLPNFFHCKSLIGLTDGIANRVIKCLNTDPHALF